MRHSIAHDLGKERARKAVLAAFESYRARFARYDPNASWKTQDQAAVAFTAKGITLRGAVEIREASVELDLDIPLLLRPWKDRALVVVQREIETWLEKARRGEV